MRITPVRLRSARAWDLSTGRHAPAELELVATLYLPNLAGDAAPGGGPATGFAPGLVVGHGAGSHRGRHDEFCQAACSHGFAVLALDFRGHGESAGAADGPLELDILAAAAFLRDHPAVDGARLCYRGSSMGGFYGLKAAAEMHFAAVALLCPAGERELLDALDLAEDTHGTGRAEAQVPPEAEEGGGAPPTGPTRWDVPALKAYFANQDSLALAGRVRCPVLLVHAREDSVVPFDHSLALAGRLAGDTTLVALAGGTHTSAQHDPGVHRLTARWLLDQVMNACTERT